MIRENEFINSLIGRMNLEQKVGALFTLSFTGVVPKSSVYDYITKYQCGGLRLTPQTRLFGSYIDPRSDKMIVDLGVTNSIKYKAPAPVPTASEYKQVLSELQELAQSRPLSLPLHFSYDQEGGTSADFSFGGLNFFSKPMGLRATGDKKVAYLVGKAVAEQSKSVGFSWIHSPVLDINTIPNNPEIGTRAYSDNVEDVVNYSMETCRGLKEGGMITTAKHFPGRGDSAVDAHYQVPVIDVDRETMFNRELLPYIKLIEADLLPSIMIAHSIFPAFDSENIATVSRKILTGLLREEMNFKGVICTDSMTMGGVATKYGVPQACALSLMAGADLVLLKAENNLVEETINLVKTYVLEGKLSEEELNDKVYRVLSLKHEYGMFYNEAEVSATPEEVFARPDLRKLSKHVAKKTVLVARDEESYLPLKKEERTLIVEQRVSHMNDFRWHSGILYENCVKLGANVDYLETDNRYDKEDKERIQATFKGYTTVVFTNYYSRANLSNIEFIQELIEDFSGKVVVVTNTPYKELSIPQNAKSVVVTFATAPDNIEVTAGAIYGTICPEGTWPINHKL